MREYVRSVRNLLMRSDLVGILRIRQAKSLRDDIYLRREKDKSLHYYCLGKVCEDLLGEVDHSNLSKVHQDIIHLLLSPLIPPPSPSLSPESIRNIRIQTNVLCEEPTSVPLPPSICIEAKEHTSRPTAEQCDSPTDSGIAEGSGSIDQSENSIDFGVSDIVNAASDIIVAATPILPGPVAAITGAVGLIKTGCQITKAVREKKNNLKRTSTAPRKKTPPRKVQLAGLPKIEAYERDMVSSSAKSWLGLSDVSPPWNETMSRYSRWKLHESNSCVACDLIAHYYHPDKRGDLDGTWFRNAVFFHQHCTDPDFDDFYRRCVRNPDHWINSRFCTLTYELIR